MSANHSRRPQANHGVPPTTLEAVGIELNPGVQRAWRMRAMAVIGGLLLFRLVYVALFPADLVVDEAYYWDWSRQLDWGYYSKPPMIAWVIGAGTWLVGDTVFGVRMPAVLLGTLGLLFAFRLAERLYGSRAGFFTVLAAAAAPGAAAASLMMTIDAPFLACWVAALYSLWRMLERNSDRHRWLLAAIVATGLGLLSKQTTIAIFPLAILFVIVSRDDRQELRRPALWLWIAGSLAFLAPVVWWNSQHDWITLEHTRHHFAGNAASLLRRITIWHEFMLSQAIVVSPVTWGLLVVLAVCTPKAWHTMGRRERYLWCFSVPPLAGVVVLALKQRVEPNWPAPFYATGAMLVVGWAVGAVNFAPHWPRKEIIFRRGLAAGALLVVATYLMPWGIAASGLVGGKLDPLVRLRGWNELAQATEQVRERMPRQQQTLVVLTTGRGPVGELAFYLPDHPQVYNWHGEGRVVSQYDIWNGPVGKEGWDALIISDAGEPIPPELQAAFDRLEPEGELCVPVGGTRAHRFSLWRGVSLRAWPDKPLPETIANRRSTSSR